MTSTEEAQGPGLAPVQGKEEGKGKGKNGSVAKVLVVFAEGTTLLMEHAPGQESSLAENGAVNGVSIVWWRDEAYTRLRQAVVVDDARSGSHLHAHGSSSHPEGGDQQLPGLMERLVMHQEDLLQMLRDVQAFALSLPHVVMAHALTGFGMLAKAPKQHFSNQDPATLGISYNPLRLPSLLTYSFIHSRTYSLTHLFLYVKAWGWTILPSCVDAASEEGGHWSRRSWRAGSGSIRSPWG